ncbi:unnamed protein product [Gongylonema pulchrum]|uniref:Uncharacterized protein n=1 Tax=Gongylonema pulchrum TaxID=637853 RepID=A0A183DZT4_9BILA|nr:unnamed protein product [Gongylonema pulchrum]
MGSVLMWLKKLKMLKYKHLFDNNSQFVLSDLDEILNQEYLLSLDISQEDAAVMLSSYLDWFTVFNAQRLSSLSSSGSTVRVHRTRVSDSFRTPSDASSSA